MLTKPLEADSRMLLWLMAADGIEATGRMLARWWAKTRRSGRLAVQLQKFEAAGWVAPTEGPLDSRIFALTELGRRCVWGDVDAEARWTRTWDGKWRFAMFDVPQSRVALRTRLRRKLSELHFGWLQNSVWLSPDTVGDLVRQLTQQAVSVESLLFVEGRPAAGESDAELVAGAWDFPKLATLYASYLKLLRLRPAAGRIIKSTDWAAWADAEHRAWRAILRADPLLPESLLPANYTGRIAWHARQESLGACVRVIATAVARD